MNSDATQPTAFISNEEYILAQSLVNDDFLQMIQKITTHSKRKSKTRTKQKMLKNFKWTISKSKTHTTKSLRRFK